jgi:hypothetical protein
VAAPACGGLRALRKKDREPVEDMVEGRCGGVVAGALEAGVQRSQRRKSMSWQDFVRRDGAVMDSLRQLPL